MPYRNAFAFAASLWLLTGCSALETLDELSVGRAERVDAPPFVVEYSLPVPAVQPDLVLIAPVRLDDPRNREDWPPGREAALAPLLAAMNDHLAGRGCCSSAAVAEPPAGGPFLYVGSAEAEDVPAPAAVERLPGAEYPAMVVYYEKPTADWQAWLGDAMRRSGARHAVWLQVGIAEFPKADKGWFGKQVHLGTGYSRSIEFLSAVDKPVEVVEVTGLLLDSSGKVLRAGGEGFYASDTLFRYQIFDVTRTIDHEQVARLVTDERREDLPGAPPAWQVALDNLLEQLMTPSLR